MGLDFVVVEDTSKVVHVLNIKQIVRVTQSAIEWQVYVTDGDTVLLDPVQAAILFKALGVAKQVPGPILP